MKNFPTIFFLFLYIVQPVTAQPGFNQTYDLSISYTDFRSILVDNDTIVFTGVARSIDSPFVQIALIGRVDTNGAILGYQMIEDSLGDYLYVEKPLIKTADGGYAFVAAILFRNTVGLFKVNKDLTLESVFEFVDTVNLATFYKEIIAIEDGYLLSGYVQRPDHKYDGFVRKINEQGSTMWFKYYGQATQGEQILGMTRLTDTIFALYGNEGTSFTDPDELHSRIWIINSSGAILKNWNSADSLKAMGILKLLPTPDDGFLAFTRTFLGYNAWNDYILQPTLLKLDEDFNIEWVKPFGPAHSSFSIWHDMKPTPDGNFIGAGRVAPYDIDDLDALLSGWLYKFTPEGDSIWARADRTEIPYESGIDDNYFGGVDFLSSGSVVAGGTSYVNGQFYGWIIKVTPDGCLDTLFCQPSAVQPEPPRQRVQVYPNPATDWLQVVCDTGGKSEFMLSNSIGQPVLHRRLPAGGGIENISVQHLPAGLYDWQVNAPGGRVAAGKLIVQR